MRLFHRLNRRFHLRYRLEYLVGLVGVYGIRALSPAFAWAAARAIARFVFALGVRRRAALDNLAVAFPGMSERERIDVARRSFEHVASMAVDVIFQQRMVSKRRMGELFDIRGWAADWLRTHGEAGLRERARRILFLTSHIGNWELASGFFALLGVRIVPVYRATANPYFNRLLMKLRLESQQNFIERRGAVQEILACFERGENVGFVYDQEAVYGIFVPFFGMPLCTHKTPAVLQRDYGVKIFFGTMIRKGDFFRYEASGEMLEPPPPTADREADHWNITADLMRRVEEAVRRNPEQFLWGNRRWKRKEKA